MKIAIVGSFGVGKTTLAHQIKEVTNIRVLPEVARVMAESGHQLDSEATPELELKIADYQVRLESGYEEWIADRCLIDLLAYCMVLFKNESELLNKINIELARAKYDFVFYLEPEFAIENDGVRSTNESYQKAINEQIKYILEVGEFKWYRISGSREERLKAVLKIINK